MSPERLRSFISKRPTDAARLALVHDGGLGSNVTVATWSTAEIDAHEDPSSGVAAIFEHVEDAAQDHANNAGEACRFMLQWQSKAGAVLRSSIHSKAPEKDAKEGNAAPTAMSANTIVTALLDAFIDANRIVPAALAPILKANAEVLQIQRDLATQLAEQNRLMALERDRMNGLALPATTREPTAQENEVLQLKAEALRRLIAIGPDILQLGMTAGVAALAQKFGINLGVNVSANGAGVNGAASTNGVSGDAH
jgi:hypothetical protein